MLSVSLSTKRELIVSVKSPEHCFKIKPDLIDYFKKKENLLFNSSYIKEIIINAK